jgi:heme oxygenase (mycobilin-producing)
MPVISSDVSPRNQICDIVPILLDPISFDFAFLTKVYFTQIVAFGIDSTHEDIILQKKPFSVKEVIVAVKIFIKRRLPLDKAKAQYIVSIFRQLRMLSLEQKGYISSETLRSMENAQEFLVISTWRSLEDWQKWFNSNQRKELHSKVDMLLDGGTTYEAYQYGFMS